MSNINPLDALRDELEDSLDWRLSMAKNHHARDVIMESVPTLLDVAEAAWKQIEAYEHDRTCEEEGEGACCLEAHHQAYLAMTAAFKPLKVNPGQSTNLEEK